MNWIVCGSIGAAFGIAVTSYAMEPQIGNVDRQAACSTSGGVIRSYGTDGRRWFCDKPFVDAGKICTAKSDCAGECTLPDDYHWVRGQKPRTVGTCQARTRVGCMTILDKGLPTQSCVD